MPVEFAHAYTRDLGALVLGLAALPEPSVIPLTAEADAAVLTIECEVEPRLAPGGAWGHVVDWGSKYTGAIVRIAGLLHLGEHLGVDKPIGSDTIARAAAIGRYFAEHALVAFDDMGADPTVEDARYVLGWIERTATGRFTKRELFSAVARGRFPKAGDLDPALNLLQAHGYIRAEPAPIRAGSGRPPSPAWLTHPDITRPAATVHPLSAVTR